MPVTPIKADSLPSARIKTPLVDQWIDLFNTVVQTPQLLNTYRKVRFIASLQIEQWDIGLEMPQRLDIREEDRFRKAMAEAGWIVVVLRRTADKNSYVEISHRRRDELYIPKEVAPDE